MMLKHAILTQLMPGPGLMSNDSSQSLDKFRGFFIPDAQKG